MAIQTQLPFATDKPLAEFEIPSDTYYYFALSAGIIGIFAAFIPIMPIFTFVFTYKSYLECGRYKGGVVLGILNVMAALVWLSIGVIRNELFGS